ncbi:Bacterial regulatory proteins, luxR family [Arthrobacter saudimassiliensis]|uniref:Bacterial regulatory proteins, luxR family n=1 Tax=Arthrobacter saudimassiliensis TaxID=1461584 RepID=A0A078MJG8_9MICC|nr:Bacterial regulatory proteins, luxR family [Arthrobacter saudimassiliensis]
MEIGSEPGAARLVGRGEQYRELIDAVAGGRLGAIVVGASGVGKTVLVRAACNELSDRYCYFHIRGSTVSAKTPYGAMGWLLGELPEGPGLGPVLLLPRLHAHLLRRAGTRTPLLVIDNADLLDRSSLSIISQLVRAFSIPLLATVEGMSGHLAEFTSLWSDGLVSRIDLDPLTRGQTAQLMEQLLDGRVSARAAASMWSESGGNPHYVTLLTREQRDAGTLVRRDGTWVLAAPYVHTGEIAELMAARLRRMTPGERKLVEVLALMVVLPLDSVLRLVPAEAVEAMEERRTIEITATQTPVVRISIAASAALVAAAVPAGRSRELWEEVSALIRPEELEPPAIAAYAAWTLRCGSRLEPALALAAARLENASGNPAAALRYVRCVQPAVRTRDTVVEEVEALTQMGRIVEASNALAGYLSAPEPQNPGDRDCPSSRLDLVLLRVRLELAVGDPAQAAVILESAAKDLDDDDAARPIGHSSWHSATADRARIHLARASLALDTGASRDADQVQLEVLAKDIGNSPSIRATAYALRAAVLASQGDAAGAMADVDAGRALLSDQMPAAGQDEVYRRLFEACVLSGDLRAAAELSWDRLALPPQQATFRGSAGEMARGLAAVLGGRADDAVDLLAAAVGQLRHRDPDNQLPLAQAGLACAHALQGNVVRARTLAGEVSPFKYRRGWLMEQLRILLLLQAELAGTDDAVTDQLLAAARYARGRGQPAMALLQLSAAAGSGRSDVLGEIGVLTAEMTGPWAAALGGYASGRHGGNAAALVVSARNALELHQYLLALHAAQAARQAADGPRGVTAQEARSLESAAHRALRHSNRMEHRLARLTEFERDLAGKAAGPLTRQEISAALNLSPRTVDWHLGKLFAKLRVSGRAELREQMDLGGGGQDG